MSLIVNHNMMAANVANNLSSHYGNLATSTQRLSTGLRINSAADDAAGLAIRELMRADIATLHQGARNANDAISLIQTADGALSVIDEKLIRMKELAEQAATGTYDSTQRLMIDSEFQQMAAEIDRIAHATDFNGIHLLDGTLGGDHEGSGLTSSGAMKIHFGSGNDSAEDYYYIEIGDCSVAGLGLGGPVKIQKLLTKDDVHNSSGSQSGDYSKWSVEQADISNAKNYLIDPTDDNLQINSITYDGHIDSLGIFKNGYGAGLSKYMENGIVISSGKVESLENMPSYFGSDVMGTSGDSDLQGLVGPAYPTYDAASVSVKFTSDSNKIYFNIVFATEEYPGFIKNDKYNDVCGIFLDGIPYTNLSNIESIDGVAVTPPGYTGSLTQNDIFTQNSLYVDNTSGAYSFSADGYSHTLRFGIPVPDDGEHTLKFAITDRGDSGYNSYFLVNGISTGKEVQANPDSPHFYIKESYETEPIHIDTQDNAQYALTRIDRAIESKDKIRANLGAMQNRLENTITNITTQTENLQASESRISDVDVATEMTNFVRNQILTQSAVAMLSQANSMPQMAMQIIGG